MQNGTDIPRCSYKAALHNARTYSGKNNSGYSMLGYDLIEVMACPGGCNLRSRTSGYPKK
jgi:hypothetical protein